MSNNQLRNLIIAGIFIVPFIPLVVTESLFFPFITGKAFTFRILIGVLFSFWAILALRDPDYHPKKSWILISLAIFVGIVAIADIFSKDPFKSFWSNFERMEGLITLIYLLVYFVIVSTVFKEEKWWQRWFQASIVASVIMSIYAILQLVGKIPINQGGVRVDGTFGNAIYLAVYMLMHIFLALLFLTKQEKIQIKAVYAGIIVLQSVILFYTATRGAILGFLGGIILTAALMIFLEKENKKIRRFGIIFLAGMMVLISGFFIAKDSRFVRGNPVLNRFASISINQFKTQGRYYVWPMAFEGFKERPLLGWGQESFNYVFNKNYHPRMYNLEQWFDRVHSAPLDWLVASGLLGLLAYLSFFGSVLVLVWRKNTLSLREKSIFSGLLAGYFFHNLFAFDNLISYIMFVSIAGYVHTAAIKDVKTETNSEKISKRSFGPGIYVPVASVILVLVYWINIPPIKANINLYKAVKPDYPKGYVENLSYFKKFFINPGFAEQEGSEHLARIVGEAFNDPLTNAETKKEFFDLGVEKLQKQTKHAPDDTRRWVFWGLHILNSKRYDEAIEILNKALELSPGKQSIYFEIARAYLEKGDKKKALEMFRTIYELEPFNKEAKLLYADASAYAGDLKGAEEIISGVDVDYFLYEDRLVGVYLQLGRYEDIINILKRRIKEYPNILVYRTSLVGALIESEQRDEAIAEVKEIMRLWPDFEKTGEKAIEEIKAGGRP